MKLAAGLAVPTKKKKESLQFDAGVLSMRKSIDKSSAGYPDYSTRQGHELKRVV